MLKESPIVTDTGFLLAEVTRQLRSIFEVEMSGRGLTEASWRALAYLAREDGQTQAQLARTLEISRVAMGEMIDRLERDGWVERRKDSNDRRAWRIHLSVECRKNLPAFRAAATEIQSRCFAGLSEVQIAKLQEILLQLRQHLQQVRTDKAPQEEDV